VCVSTNQKAAVNPQNKNKIFLKRDAAQCTHNTIKRPKKKTQTKHLPCAAGGIGSMPGHGARAPFL